MNPDQTLPPLKSCNSWTIPFFFLTEATSLYYGQIPLLGNMMSVPLTVCVLSARTFCILRAPLPTAALLWIMQKTDRAMLGAKAKYRYLFFFNLVLTIYKKKNQNVFFRNLKTLMNILIICFWFSVNI